ncbi:protein translocase subunit secE/sec61 gamma [Orbus hercynius]|uniref:Protein translocase subunit SecE n=1 Tax=Orbus hercynius TaxID=593135 RepID=A0A495RF81_9GAMM|nr:protein translocase subunit secE/sec61 gamma [Orbus hercynius]
MSIVRDNQETSKSFDKIKWFFVFVLVALIVWGNFYFSEPDAVYQPGTIIRIVGVVVLSALTLLLAMTTNKGKSFITFAKESRMEVRKVVWPTRKETIQTTLLIAVITIVVGLCLWGLDTFFFWGISKLTVLGH